MIEMETYAVEQDYSYIIEDNKRLDEEMKQAALSKQTADSESDKPISAQKEE